MFMLRVDDFYGKPVMINPRFIVTIQPRVEDGKPGILIAMVNGQVVKLPYHIDEFVKVWEDATNGIR